MLRQLSSSHDNGQNMVIYPWSIKHGLSVVIVSWQRSEHGEISLKYSMKHAPSVVIVSWQRSEHGYISFMNETCSVRCLCLITTDRAWLYIPKVWKMLVQLSSSHDNGQSMVFHPLGMKDEPSVVIVSWQRTEHGYTSQRFETCSSSCHRLVTTFIAW